ncbi:MAG: hypothetical protein BWY66_01517 [bacterium ADurb.Bin374]|nr:MAG: hypothetical protein BWY66_01517 [bacterium ADurb.Bin374]
MEGHSRPAARDEPVSAEPARPKDDELPVQAERHEGRTVAAAAQRYAERLPDRDRHVRQPADAPSELVASRRADRRDLHHRRAGTLRAGHFPHDEPLDEAGTVPLPLDGRREARRFACRNQRGPAPILSQTRRAEASLSRGAYRNPGRAREAVLQRRPRIHQHPEALRLGQRLRAPDDAGDRTVAGQRQTGWKGRRPVSGGEDSHGGEGTQHRPSQPVRAENMVHHLGRRARLSALQRPRGDADDQIPRSGRNPAGIRVCRTDFQELEPAPGNRVGADHGARGFWGDAADRSVFKPARRHEGVRLRREIQEPVRREPRYEEGAPRSPDGCDRRGVCQYLRPGPDRISTRTRPARLQRGNGHHDPAGRRQAGRQLLVPGLRRGRVQLQRVPVVTPHQARGWDRAARRRPRHSCGRPHGRGFPDADLPRPAGAAREYYTRRYVTLCAEKHRCAEPRDEPVRDHQLRTGHA